MNHHTPNDNKDMNIGSTVKTALAAMVAMAATVSCTEVPTDEVLSHSRPKTWPDIAGVTIPARVAPLNFNVEDADKVYVMISGEKGGSISAGGEWADIDIDEWHDLTERNRGADLTFTISTKKSGRWTRHEDIKVHVSEDNLNDYGLTYRKIAPGYETYSDIGLYQRDIHSFDEEPIIASTLVPGQCMCCHTANRANPDQLTLHLRGSHAATLVMTDGQRKWLTTKTDSTLCNCMYPYWHPSGNYCAYSLNKVAQGFMTGSDKFIEVLDKASDACVMDVRTNELILSPALQTADNETYPVFSADGRKIFYCTAKPKRIPAEAQELRYDLCAVGFDAKNGIIGIRADTVLKVSDQGGSISLPRPSYDGRFIMFCKTDYGYFPIDHREADLWVLDLRSGESHPATEANSADTESFHNWSSDSRWVVFSSRRHDGMTSLAYIAHVDTLGNVSKPFLLPQRNPKKFHLHSLHSFNTPDFTTKRVNLPPRETYNEVFADTREQVTIRM